MVDTVLVIAAHADDEVLGCGGTIACHVAKGDNVKIVFMADGVGSRGDKSTLLQREKAACDAAEVLGASTPVFLGFPDNKMDSTPLLDIVQKLEAVIKDVKPSIIYTHYAGDLNVDHEITHRAVLTACRPQPDFCVKEIYSFEVLSSTEWNKSSHGVFDPMMIVDISNSFDRKMAALKKYDMEMRTFPHARSYESVEALATYRGASFGFSKAEAFVVNRVLKG